jgi:hypothetical protein
MLVVSRHDPPDRLKIHPMFLSSSSDVTRGGRQMSITDDALSRPKDLILSGELEPGSQLPPERKLTS